MKDMTITVHEAPSAVTETTSELVHGVREPRECAFPFQNIRLSCVTNRLRKNVCGVKEELTKPPIRFASPGEQSQPEPVLAYSERARTTKFRIV